MQKTQGHAVHRVKDHNILEDQSHAKENALSRAEGHRKKLFPLRKYPNVGENNPIPEIPAKIQKEIMVIPRLILEEKLRREGEVRKQILVQKQMLIVRALE